MSEDYELVKADFDEISELEETGWNHNSCYYKQLIKSLPQRLDFCLDIGCGKGGLSRLLSEKYKHVTAVDLSGRMIEKAKN